VTRLLPLLVPTLAFAHPGHVHAEPTTWPFVAGIAAVTVLAWRRVLRTQKTP
jgi:hypothetical protein